MAPKKNYSRYFIILQEDEKGFGLSSDKKPSGYVKLERKQDKCKVYYYAQNISRDKEPYSLVLVCRKKNTKALVELGKIELDSQGRIDKTYEYDAIDLANSRMDVDKVIGAAIVKGIDDSIVCAMSGFISSDIPTGSKDYPMTRGEEVQEEIVEEVQNDYEKYERDVEESKQEENADKNYDEVKEQLEQARETEIKETQNRNDDVVEDCDSKEVESVQEEAESGEDLTRDHDKKHDKHDHYDEHDCPIGSEGAMFKRLVEDFEEVDYMTKEFKNCRWFNVEVDDIERLYDMSDYDRYCVIYYPMICYYAYIKKYKHFNVGYKCNAKGRLTHIVYAIPGDRDKDDQPFAGKTGFVTWVPCKDRHKSKGYWLMFYDIKHCTVVVPVKK